MFLLLFREGLAMPAIQLDAVKPASGRGVVAVDLDGYLRAPGRLVGCHPVSAIDQLSVFVNDHRGQFHPGFQGLHQHLHISSVGLTGFQHFGVPDIR